MVSGDASLMATDALASSTPPQNQAYILTNSTASAAPGAYEFSSTGPTLYKLGNSHIGYIRLTANNGMVIDVGHLKDDRSKFVVSITLADLSTYRCISSGWSEAEKPALAASLGVSGALATCVGDITLNTVNLFKMVRAPIVGASNKKIVLNVNTTLLPIVFPVIGQLEVLADSTPATPGVYEFDVSAASSVQDIGSFKAGYVSLAASGGLTVNVGHLKGDKSKFFVSVVQTGEAPYECISAAWSEGEKEAAQLAFGATPVECGAGIVFNGTTNTFSMTNASLTRTGGDVIKLNVSATPVTINIP